MPAWSNGQTIPVSCQYGVSKSVVNQGKVSLPPTDLYYEIVQASTPHLLTLPPASCPIAPGALAFTAGGLNIGTAWQVEYLDSDWVLRTVVVLVENPGEIVVSSNALRFRSLTLVFGTQGEAVNVRFNGISEYCTIPMTAGAPGVGEGISKHGTFSTASDETRSIAGVQTIGVARDGGGQQRSARMIAMFRPLSSASYLLARGPISVGEAAPVSFRIEPPPEISARADIVLAAKTEDAGVVMISETTYSVLAPM